MQQFHFEFHVLQIITQASAGAEKKSLIPINFMMFIFG